jgi:hypothetical protein
MKVSHIPEVVGGILVWGATIRKTLRELGRFLEPLEEFLRLTVHAALRMDGVCNCRAVSAMARSALKGGKVG